jgi:hypothetical protein
LDGRPAGKQLGFAFPHGESFTRCEQHAPDVCGEGRAAGKEPRYGENADQCAMLQLPAADGETVSAASDKKPAKCR